MGNKLQGFIETGVIYPNIKHKESVVETIDSLCFFNTAVLYNSGIPAVSQ